MLDLYEELVQQTKAFDQAEIPYALVGGIGFSLYVHPRATEDMDFLIYPDDWERVKLALEPLGWLSLAGPLDFKTISIRRLTKLAGEDVMVADFLLADKETIPGLQKYESLSYQGQALRLAPPEVIIALKLRRNAPKDQEDIRLLKILVEKRNNDPGPA
jgi:hypothetical protein